MAVEGTKLMRRIEGMVLTLRCASCSCAFPTFIFSGDTDMATDGLDTATSLEPISVAIAELTNDECRAGYAVGRAQFAERIGRLYGASFVALSPIRWIEGPSAAGLSFQQFQQIYEPPAPIYGCPQCSGEASATSQQTPAEFLEAGGRLLIASNFHLG